MNVLDTKPEYRELRDFTVKELKQELAALERDGRRGFHDPDAVRAVKDELATRPSFFKSYSA